MPKMLLLDVTLTCEDDFVSIRELSCGPQSVRNFEVSVDFSKLTGTKESEILVQAEGCEVKVKSKSSCSNGEVASDDICRARWYCLDGGRTFCAE